MPWTQETPGKNGGARKTGKERKGERKKDWDSRWNGPGGVDIIVIKGEKRRGTWVMKLKFQVREKWRGRGDFRKKEGSSGRLARRKV